MYSISASPPLDDKTERALADRAQAGDADAMAQLVQANIKWISRQARRYEGPRMPLDDLVQAGVVGFIESVIKWVPEDGVTIRGYAQYRVRREMSDAVVAYVPDYTISPSAMWRHGMPHSGALVDAELHPFTLPERFADRALLEALLRQLPPQARRILVMSYGLGATHPMTDAQIAEVIDVDRSTVTRVRGRALKALEEIATPDFVASFRATDEIEAD